VIRLSPLQLSVRGDICLSLPVAQPIATLGSPLHRSTATRNLQHPPQTIMLCIRTGARLLGISKAASTFGGSRGHTGPHTTVLSAVPNRPSQILLFSIPLKGTLTAFSTRPHGLCKIMYTGFKLGSPSLYKQRAEPSLAQRAFEKSNPFDDPDARHCLAFIDTKDRYLDSSYIWTEDATIVDRELSKHVRAAGKTVSRVRIKFNTSRHV